MHKLQDWFIRQPTWSGQMEFCYGTVSKIESKAIENNSKKGYYRFNCFIDQLPLSFTQNEENLLKN